MSSASLSQLIADTQRLMAGLGAGSGGVGESSSASGEAAARLASPLRSTAFSSPNRMRSPTRHHHMQTTASTTTTTQRTSGSSTTAYEEHKSSVASSVHAAALRSLSPRPTQLRSPTALGRSRTPDPMSPSRSGRLFTRSHSFVPLKSPAAHMSPLSPRAQARQALSTNGLGGMRSPHLTSPPTLRSSFDVGGTFAAGLGASSSMRAASASPTRDRFREVADASRDAAAKMDATLRFENLDTPAIPIQSRSRIGSPIRSPTRFTAGRPSALDASAIRAANAVANSYVFAPIEPWRELNRQLALNGYQMVAPFPVPSTAATADLPWSPNSTRFFRGIPVQAPSAALNTLLANFTALLGENARRGQTIHDLMNKQMSENTQQAHYQTELQSLRRVNGQLQAQIVELQHSLETSSFDRASTLKNLSGQIELSANQFKSIEHQLQQTQREFKLLDHQYQQAQRELTLRDQEARDAKRLLSTEANRASQSLRERDAQVAHQLQRARDLERERDEHAHRVRDLERELAECQAALVVTQTQKRADQEDAQKRERDFTYLAQLKTSEFEEKLTSLSHAAEQDRQATRLRFAEQEDEFARAKRSMEEEFTRARRLLEEQLTLAQAQLSEMSGLNGLLRADLTAVQAKSAAQEDQLSHLTRETGLKEELIRQLEGKADGLQQQAIDGYNRQELSKYLDAFQSAEHLLQREQLGSSFDVLQVHSLPKELLAELVLLVCLKLKVSDATSIGSSLDQLINVASAVSGMQAFIAQIWGVVHGADGQEASQLSAENLISLTTSVIPTLRQWRFASESTSELQRFRLDILDALRRRQHRSPLNPLHSASGASSAAASSVKLHDQLPNDELVFEVNDIVANENRLNALVFDQHASPSSFFQLWAQLDKTPLTTQPYSQESERIIAHIQQLFDIPHRIGLFPKMNELFLFVNETRPAIQAMRALLRLDSRATIHTCIKALKRLVDGHGLGGFNESMSASSSVHPGHLSRAFSPERSMSSSSRQEGNGRGLAWTVTSPSKHESSFLHSVGGGGSSAPTKSQLHKNAQYFTICKQLLAQLGCKKMNEIVVAVSQLQQQAAAKHQSDFLTQSILTQLTSMLECANMTELPSAVIRLKEDLALHRRHAQVHEEERAQLAALSANHASQELARQMAQKREEFIVNLKQIVGIGEVASDTALVDAISRLTAQSSSTSPATSQQQRDHQLIIAQLRGYLDVRSQDEIVSTVRTLINRLCSMDEIFPTLDSMVSRLYDLLHVSTLEDIVPAVRRLVAHSTAESSSHQLARGGGARTTGGPIAHSSANTFSAASSVRAVRDSVENSPTLSSISSGSHASTAASDQSGPVQRGQGLTSTTTPPDANRASGSPASTVTRTTTTTSHHSSSLYITGQSPYRATATSAGSSVLPPAVSVGRVSFDSEGEDQREQRARDREAVDDALASYVPASSSHDRAQREADAAAVHEEVQRQLEEEAIDRALNLRR